MTVTIDETITFETRDEYFRKSIAEKVVQLLASDAQVSPMIIDGNWGTGKTEFCLKLKNLIEEIDEPDYKAVYIDAFKADHADEPIMTILSSVIKLLPESDRPTLISKALPVLRIGLKASLKAGVSWVLKQDVAQIAADYSGEINEAGEDAINMAVESVLKDHVNAEQNIHLLQSALKEISETTPIVIFIDELDRCRPDFAVNMLETIKHVFNVSGVQFVLVTNLSQLRASINHCYGRNIDSQRYLDKFLGYSFKLPETYKPGPHVSMKASITHLEVCIGKSKILSESCLSVEGNVIFIKTLVEKNNLSLREVETFIRYLEIYQTLTDGEGFKQNLKIGYFLLRIMAVFLFCFKPESADEFYHEYFSARPIANALGVTKLIDFDEEKNEYPSVEEVVVAMVGTATKFHAGDFVLNGDEKRIWERVIMEYFKGGGGYPSDKQRVQILTNAFDVLKLNVQK